MAELYVLTDAQWDQAERVLDEVDRTQRRQARRTWAACLALGLVVIAAGYVGALAPRVSLSGAGTDSSLSARQDPRPGASASPVAGAVDLEVRNEGMFPIRVVGQHSPIAGITVGAPLAGEQTIPGYAERSVSLPVQLSCAQVPKPVAGVGLGATGPAMLRVELSRFGLTTTHDVEITDLAGSLLTDACWPSDSGG